MSWSNHDKPDKMKLNGTKITNTNKKLLHMLIDKKVSFNVQIKSLCKIAGQTVSALGRISIANLL